VTEDEEPSTWPDYLPRDWVDVPESRMDPVSVLAWVILAVMIAFMFVLMLLLMSGLV
jgi:hypothetical protein